jgi:hypothetical protein
MPQGGGHNDDNYRPVKKDGGGDGHRLHRGERRSRLQLATTRSRRHRSTTTEGHHATVTRLSPEAKKLYGRFLVAQKRDAERVFQHMDAAEREAFLRRLTEINAADAEDGQSLPPNPTPV